MECDWFAIFCLLTVKAIEENETVITLEIWKI